MSKLFIGGLAWHTDEEELGRKFEEFGMVEEAVAVRPEYKELRNFFQHKSHQADECPGTSTYSDFFGDYYHDEVFSRPSTYGNDPHGLTTSYNHFNCDRYRCCTCEAHLPLDDGIWDRHRDENTRRYTSSKNTRETMHAKTGHWDELGDSLMDSCQNRNLLTLDGGGVRGFSSLMLLEELMKRVKISGKQDGKSCDIFDFVGGTSSGGLIAIMLARLRNMVEERALHDQPMRECTSMRRGSSKFCTDRSSILDRREYLDWRNSKNTSLWLSGSPGTGKSTLMKTIARQSQKNQHEKEPVFFYRVDPDYKIGSPLIDILGGILIELLSCNRSIRSRRNMESLFANLVLCEGCLSSSSIELILSQVRHSLEDDEILYVLIDGLDEWDHNQEEQSHLFELVDLLSRQDSSHHIKCLFSAKPTSKISLRYEHRIDLDSRGCDEKDLELHVREGLEGLRANCEDLAVEQITRAVVEHANGIFLWTQLVIQNCLPTRSEQEFNLSDPLGLLETCDIPALYDKLFQKMQGNHQSAGLSMLRWVTYAARPLHVSELLDALHMETGIKVEELSIAGSCAGLLQLDDSGIVRLVHPSLREYLVNRMKRNWEVVSDEANEIIAHVCLKSLRPKSLLDSLTSCCPSQAMDSRDRVYAMLDLSSDGDDFTPSPVYSRDSASQGLKSGAAPFESYAQQFWMYHYRLAEYSSTFLAGMLHSALESSLEQTQNANDDELGTYLRDEHAQKPRLSKQDVEVLERAFLENPKPRTQKKRNLAEMMNIDLARINNWFQNRRAKQKQEEKQRDYEGSHPVEPSQYHAQFNDPSKTSMGSLYHTISAASGGPFTHNNRDAGVVLAARFGLTKLLKLELEMGANANATSGKEQLTPLMWAAISNSRIAVELLLQYGADPHLVSKSGNQALTYAIENGHVDVVQLLMENHIPTEIWSFDYVFSDPCHTCGNIKRVYNLAPCRSRDDANCGDRSAPIFVKGNPQKPKAMPTNSFLIKWPAGTHLRRALAVAATLGVDKLRALLIAVGNDVRVLDESLAITRLASALESSSLFT